MTSGGFWLWRLGRQRGPRGDWRGYASSARHITAKEVCEYIQRHQGTVSRFESGEYPIRRGDLLAFLDLYGVSNKRRRDSLMALREEVWRTGWWDGYASDVDHGFINYVWLERHAP